MKNLFRLFAAAALLMMGAACQQEAMPEGVKRGETLVNFSVELPGDAVTKAIGDGTNVDILYYEVYNADMTTKLAHGSTRLTSEKIFDLQLTLVQDQTYNFLFWAQVSTGNYYTVTDLRNVTVNYNSAVGNDEARAAFFAAETFAVGKNTLTETIYLKRPFAQLNFGTTTFVSEDMIAPVTVNSSVVTVTKASTKFDVYAKVGSSADADLAEVTFTATGCPVDPAKLTINPETPQETLYEYLSMNYFFVGGEEATVGVNAVFTTSVGDVKHNIPSVPVAENYRTNIVGDLLFNTADFRIIVDETFVADYNGNLEGEFNEVHTAADAASLKTALETAQAGDAVVLESNIVIEQKLVVPTQVTFNGNGMSVIAPAQPTDNGMVCPAGDVTVKNLDVVAEGQSTVDGKGLRALYITQGGNYVFENVNTTGTSYAINVNTTQTVTLKVTDSTLEGWTSFGGSTTATLERVNFTSGLYAMFRPYGKTVLKDCSFEDGFTIDLGSQASGASISFENCTYGGVALAAEHLSNADGKSVTILP